MELVEVRPLKAFVGSYRCSLEECDSVDEVLTEKDGGLIVKEKVPRKRYRGFVPIDRKLMPSEVDAYRAGKLPDNLEMIDEGTLHVREHSGPRTVRVPADVADSLVSRGLAERIKQPKIKPNLG